MEPGSLYIRNKMFWGVPMEADPVHPDCKNEGPWGGGQNLLKDVSSPACLCIAPPLGAETSLWVSHLGSR